MISSIKSSWILVIFVAMSTACAQHTGPIAPLTPEQLEQRQKRIAERALRAERRAQRAQERAGITPAQVPVPQQ